MTPMADIMATSASMDGMRSTDASRPACLSCTAGAVARCSTKAVTPTANSNAAANGPACGNQATLSPTAKGGPRIKLISSATDSNA
ncbi:hypothetical protein D3C72_2372730 [compost metagenome]